MEEPPTGQSTFSSGSQLQVSRAVRSLQQEVKPHPTLPRPPAWALAPGAAPHSRAGQEGIYSASTSAQQETQWSPPWNWSGKLASNSELSDSLSAFTCKMGRTPSPWVTIRVHETGELPQRRAAARVASSPEHTPATRPAILLPAVASWVMLKKVWGPVGQVPRKLTVFALDHWAGPHAACWHHTPCVSLQEARWPFLLCVLLPYLQAALGRGGAQSRHPREPALWETPSRAQRSPATLALSALGGHLSQHHLSVFHVRTHFVLSRNPMGSEFSQLMCTEGPALCKVWVKH